MKLLDLVTSLDHWDEKGRRVFTTEDLRKICDFENQTSFPVAISRLINMSDKPVLKRVCRGVYLNTRSRRDVTNLLEEVARTIRRGSRNYISLESALSEHGWISQIPVRNLTVMTTGRSGEFKTQLGTIEFTHTNRIPEDIFERTIDRGHPLRMATVELALEDIRRVGRNLKLVKKPDEVDDREEMRHEI